MVVHHVDDPAGRVEGCGGRQGNAEVTGMEPQAGTGGRCRLSLSVFVLQRKLRLGDAFGASRNDPPLRHKGGEFYSRAVTLRGSLGEREPYEGHLLFSHAQKTFHWDQKPLYCREKKRKTQVAIIFGVTPCATK